MSGNYFHIPIFYNYEDITVHSIQRVPKYGEQIFLIIYLYNNVYFQ